MNQGTCNSLICKEIFTCAQWNELIRKIIKQTIYFLAKARTHSK
jgi:hypothetical protein